MDDEEYKKLYNDFLQTIEPVLMASKFSVMRHEPYYYATSDKMHIPYKTGKLTWQGFKVVKTSPTSWDVYIDESITPYAKYLDMGNKSTIGWWDRVVMTYISELQKRTHGILSQEAAYEHSSIR